MVLKTNVVVRIMYKHYRFIDFRAVCLSSVHEILSVGYTKIRFDQNFKVVTKVASTVYFYHKQCNQTKEIVKTYPKTPNNQAIVMFERILISAIAGNLTHY